MRPKIVSVVNFISYAFLDRKIKIEKTGNSRWN